MLFLVANCTNWLWMWSSNERSVFRPVSLPPPHQRLSHHVQILSPRGRHHVGHIDLTAAPLSLAFLHSDNYHLFLLILFPPPPCPSSLSLTAIRERNNHIDRADRSGQESGNMNSYMCQRHSEEEGGRSHISLCLIIALILWQWHTANSNSESLRPPGPIDSQELVCWHFYTDISTSNTEEQYRLGLTDELCTELYIDVHG